MIHGLETGFLFGFTSGHRPFVSLAECFASDISMFIGT
jgi:hypothetical protein